MSIRTWVVAIDRTMPDPADPSLPPRVPGAPDVDPELPTMHQAQVRLLSPACFTTPAVGPRASRPRRWGA